jgi:hypothetical protein
MDQEEVKAVEVRKLTQLELEKVREITQNLNDIRNGLGDVEIKLITLNSTKSDLSSRYSDVRAAEAKLISEFNEKYGKISINIETGEITNA